MLQAQPKYNSSELYVSVVVLVQATDTPISLIFPAHLPGLSSPPPSDFNGNATSLVKPSFTAYRNCITLCSHRYIFYYLVWVLNSNYNNFVSVFKHVSQNGPWVAWRRVMSFWLAFDFQHKHIVPQKIRGLILGII